VAGEIERDGSLHPDEWRLVTLTVASHLRGRHPRVHETGSTADPPGDLERTNADLRSRRHAVLLDFTAEVVRSRGRPSASWVRTFLEAGFDRRAVLAVLREATLRRAELCSLSDSRVEGGDCGGGSREEALSCPLPRAG